MKTYSQAKNSILKWREANRDAYNETMRRGAKTYYEKNKDKLSQEKLKRYYFKKQAEIFRNILLD